MPEYDEDALNEAYYEDPVSTTASLAALAAERAATLAAAQVQDIRIARAVEDDARKVFREAELRVLEDPDVTESAYAARAPFMKAFLANSIRDEIQQDPQAMEQAIRAAYHGTAQEESQVYWQSVKDVPGSKKFGL
jgi:hypothetical protein